jgi:hypothetical protein
MHSRRRFLATSAGVIALSGCIGDSGNGDGGNGDGGDGDGGNGDSGNGDSENGDGGNGDSDESDTPTSRPEEVDGVVSETIEKDGLEVTIEEVTQGTEVAYGIRERTALDNSQFIGYKVDVEVVGESSVEVSWRRNATGSYLGRGVTLIPSVSERGTTIDGTAVPSWYESFGEDISKDLFPGESVSGGVVVQVPEESYRPADQIIGYRAEATTVQFRGSDGQPRSPYSPPPSASGQFSFEEIVNDAGVEYTVTGYTLADQITTRRRTKEPESDAAQFIIVSFKTTNVSPVAQSILPLKGRTTGLVYAGNEADGVRSGGGALGYFKANNQLFTGMFATQGTRYDNKTNGSIFYPGITVEGSLPYQVPRQFDESNVSVNIGNVTFTP